MTEKYLQILKNFTKEHKELFTNNDFKTIYEKAFKKIDVPCLTRWLYKNNLDPLQYMDFVPTSFHSSNKHMGTFTIPNHIKRIEQEAFWNCQSLVELVLPEGLLTIGDSALSECRNLRKITLPQTLQGIGMDAFAGSGLQTITIPNSCLVIGERAFENCKELNEVIIENKLTIVQGDAFWDCNANLVIYCVKNSRAEEYCKSNGYNYIII